MKIYKTKTFFILSFVALFFLWSSAYTAITVALGDFSPGGLALFRFLVASVLLVILSFYRNLRIPDKKDLPMIMFCGFLGVAVYNIMIFYGQKNTPVAVSSILLNTYPMFVALFSILIFKEIINIIKLAGILICFIGILIVSGGDLTHFSLNGSMILLICATIIVSLYDIQQKKLMNKYTPFELTCYFIWSGTLFLLIFSGALAHDLLAVNFKSMLSALYLGTLQSVVAPLLWSQLILNYSVSSLSVFCYVTPFFAMLIAFICLHQVPTFSAILGCGVIILGLVISSFAKSSKLTNQG